MILFYRNWLLILFTIFSIPTFGQHALVYDKTFGKVKRLHFYNGQQITFKEIGNKNTYQGTITNISDSTFEVNHATFKPQNISMLIKIRRLPQIFGYALVIGGAGYFTLDTFNEATSGGNYFFDSAVVYPSAILVCAGGLLLLVSKQKLKVSKKNTLKIINTSP